MTGPKIKANKLLFCEGRDEEEFFGALFKYVGRSDVQIIPVGGKYKFQLELANFIRDPDFPQVTDILFVRDADFVADGAGFAATWTSVTNTLRHHSLPVPISHGQFTTGGIPRIAVFIMPDGASEGMLETLCVAAIQSNPATQCVRDYFNCLQSANIPGHPHLPRNQDKAFTRVFLASLPEPDKLLGQAAQAGYWPWTAPAFTPIIDLLRQL
jgi:hypothetical protein